MAKKPKHNFDHNTPNHIHVLTLRQMISMWWEKKYAKVTKRSVYDNSPPPPPQNVVINHIAVVLDEKVEEVIRAENRLAALFLSEPKFVEFNPEIVHPTIGWIYDGERFIDPNEANKKD